MRSAGGKAPHSTAPSGERLFPLRSSFLISLVYPILISSLFSAFRPSFFRRRILESYPLLPGPRPLEAMDARSSARHSERQPQPPLIGPALTRDCLPLPDRPDWNSAQMTQLQTRQLLATHPLAGHKQLQRLSYWLIPITHRISSSPRLQINRLLFSVLSFI